MGVVKVAGEWKRPGDTVELPDQDARRLINIGVADATGEEPTAPAIPNRGELEAELARLQEFERQQLAAAEADAKAQAEKEEAERKAAEKAAAKSKAKAGAKGDPDGQADGK